MKITKKIIKRLIREAMSDLEDQFGGYGHDPEESEWAAREEKGDELITGGIEETYEALIASLGEVEDPKMQADIIALFQSALKLGPEDIESYN